MDQVEATDKDGCWRVFEKWKWKRIIVAGLRVPEW